MQASRVALESLASRVGAHLSGRHSASLHAVIDLFFIFLIIVVVVFKLVIFIVELV